MPSVSYLLEGASTPLVQSPTLKYSGFVQNTGSLLWHTVYNQSTSSANLGSISQRTPRKEGAFLNLHEKFQKDSFKHLKSRPGSFYASSNNRSQVGTFY